MNSITKPEFVPFPKMARLSRQCVITEKIDGTNACVHITEEGCFFTGSRSRWITPEDDNFGFAKWAHEHKEQLLQLGPGTHFGEWWGAGIQRNYGQTIKHFSLFNTIRWCKHGQTPQPIPSNNPQLPVKMQQVLPPCCNLVPVLYHGIFTTADCEQCLNMLANNGSAAAPGFRKPEGIVVYHIAAGIGFKKTLDKDEQPKGA